MTTRPPHPLRCPTCKFAITQIHYDAYGHAIAETISCKREVYRPWKQHHQPIGVTYLEVPTDVLIWNGLHGCASHSESQNYQTGSNNDVYKDGCVVD